MGRIQTSENAETVLTSFFPSQLKQIFLRPHCQRENKDILIISATLCTLGTQSTTGLLIMLAYNRRNISTGTGQLTAAVCLSQGQF